MRIAKEGFYGGDPQKVLEAPVDMVMATMDYIIFSGEYDRVSYILNAEKQ